MQQNEGVIDIKQQGNDYLLNSSLQVTSLKNLCQLFNDKDFTFLPAEKTKQLLNTVDEDSLNGWATPEGAHRDGVNYVMMVMVNRNNTVNGATNIYDAEQSDYV